jgi:single-strand DNA-binding protein
MINKVILVGRTGKDPESTNLRDHGKVTKISIATSESYADKSGNRKDVVEWHNLTFWGNLADIAEKYLSKGKMIFVEGKLHHSTYEDKEGRKQHRSEIVVEKLRILERKEDGAEKTAEMHETNFSPEPGDDLPF